MPIPRRPLLAPWYRLVGDGERVLLEHGQVVVVLEGAAVRTLLPALLPLLDGTRTVDDLAHRLGPAAREAIDHALETLAAHRLLADGPEAPPLSRATAHAVAAAFDLDPTTAAERLEQATVGVAGSAAAGAEAARLLQAAGIGGIRRVSWRRRPETDLVVAAPAGDELDRLPAWNRKALEWDVRWLPVRPFDGRFAAVGPLVVPHESCCYECVLLRRGANLEYGRDLADVEAAPLAATAEPAVGAILAALAAHLTVRWLVGADTTLPGVMHAVELRPTPAIDAHPVLRVPRCPACSRAGTVAPPLPWHAAEAA